MNKTWLAGMGLAALAVSGCSPSKQTAATVNGHEISRDAVEQRVIQSPAAKGALRTLILEQIILDSAAKKGIKITDEDVNRYIAYQKDRLPPGKYEELTTQNGLPEAVRRADARAELALRALAIKDVKISDESIQKMYKENPANSWSKPDWKQVGLIITKDKATADKAAASLKKGADFATVTKEFTIPQALEQVKDLQWFGVINNDVITEQGQPLGTSPIATAIRKTPAGQTGAPVAMPTPDGKDTPERVLVYVKSETKGGKFPLEDVRNEITWRIANQNAQVNSEVVRDLVKEAKVDVRMEPFQDLEKPEELLPEQPAMMPGGPAPMPGG